MSDIASPFKRWSIFLYGAVCYALFHVSFTWFVLFCGNFFLPKGVDGGTQQPLAIALAINLALIALFGVQHSVMARPAFKRWFTRRIPQSAERSTYVLASNVCLALLCWLWVPMEGTVWLVENPAAKAALLGLFVVGWLLVVTSSFLIDHFELFGLRQVFEQLRGVEQTTRKFGTPGYYKVIRHPIQTGVFIFLWATPHMTLGHLVLALGMTAYILVGLWYEERDLIDAFGETYRAYQKRVPQLLPWVGWKAGYRDLNGGPPTVPVDTQAARTR